MFVQEIHFPTRPQIDTLCSLYILRRFARDRYQNVENATIVFSSPLKPNETHSQNILFLDMDGGELDHHAHPKYCLTELIINHLNLSERKDLQKLKQFAHRDDLEGKGIISQDPLDKAFGLSGLLTNLNKLYPQEHTVTVNTVLTLIGAHVKEEYRREYEMPEEVQKAKESGRMTNFVVEQNNKQCSCTIIFSDNPSISGFLRSAIGGAFDVVVIVKSTGNIVINTRPKKSISLRGLAALLRLEELKQRADTQDLDIEELIMPAVHPLVSEWYYDTTTNSLLNGSMSADNAVPASSIPKSDLRKIIEHGISERFL